MSPTSTKKKAPAKPVKAALPGLAFIGCGIQTRDMLLPQFLKLPVVIRTMCDCDRVRREDGAKRVNDAYAADEEKKAYAGVCKPEADFRKVIKDKSISMVVIVTPDHWHAYMAVEAMKAGKDVYCEKPLTYSIEEAKLVMEAQKKYKRVFQTGSWQRSRREFRTACMVVRNGLIGDVKYVDCNYGQGTDAPLLGGPSQPHRFFSDINNAEAEGAPNPDVDWDMWLGPAPWSPYSDQCAPRGVNTFYPMFWRFDDYFGTGYNGDWGAHHLDIAQWALGFDKTGPVKIIRSDAPHSKNPIHGCRRQQDMQFVFADGTVITHKPFSTWGTVFYGTKGIVAVNRGKIAVWKGRGVKPTDKIRKELADDTFKGMTSSAGNGAPAPTSRPAPASARRSTPSRSSTSSTPPPSSSTSRSSRPATSSSAAARASRRSRRPRRARAPRSSAASATSATSMTPASTGTRRRTSSRTARATRSG